MGKRGKRGRGGGEEGKEGKERRKEVVERGKEREEKGGSQYAGGKEGKGGGGQEIMSIPQHNLFVMAGHGVLQSSFSLSECIMGAAQGSVNVVYPSGVALECQVHK